MLKKNLNERLINPSINIDRRIWGFYTDGDYLGNVNGKLCKFESERAYLIEMKEREDVED